MYLLLLLVYVVGAGADTLDQVASRSGATFYVMENGDFTPIEKITGDDYRLGDPYNAYIANHANERDHIAKIDRSKQYLVYSSDNRYDVERSGITLKNFQTIIRTQYCYPVTWSTDWRTTNIYTHNGEAPVKWIDEVKRNDGTFLSMSEYLNDSGYVRVLEFDFLTRDYQILRYYVFTSFVEGEELTVCEYVGTRLHEETIKLDALFLQYHDSSYDISCPLIRTRDGYFIIDISALPVGRYVVDGCVVDILN